MSSASSLSLRLAFFLRKVGPGLALAGALALLSFLAEPQLAIAIRSLVETSYTLPAIVIALVLGIALHGFARRPIFEPGLTWCVKKLLRWAIALLGIRIALSDIVALGPATAFLVLLSMVLTILAGMGLARLLRLNAGYGALAGAANAVCGASAALATASVVPAYPQKGADVAFTIIAANAVSTIVMVLYPSLCLAWGLGAQDTGILLGATIHDMAQVVGAGYAISEPVGNTAVIVKLFRVFLLLPAVVTIGWWLHRPGLEQGAAKVPVPLFAVAFIALCLVNSIALSLPALAPVYGPIKALLVSLSAWGLLIAIAALGLQTSLASLLAIGWRHMVVFAGATLTILAVVGAGLFASKLVIPGGP